MTRAAPNAVSREPAALAASYETSAITDRLLRAGVVLAVAGAAFVTFGYLVNALLFDERFYDLNAKLEGNAFTWLSTVATFAGAFVAFVHALLFSRSRRAFGVLAGAVAFLSLDDLIQIHERAGVSVGQEMLGLSKNLADQFEIVIFVPVFAATLLIGRAVARSAPARVGRMLVIGLSLLVVSVLIEFVGVVTRRMEEDTSVNWPNQVRVAVEEGMELAGWILVSSSLAAVVCLAIWESGRRPAASAG